MIDQPVRSALRMLLPTVPAVAETGRQRAASAAAPATEPLWTVKDVAAFTGLSVRWVHERTRRGEIPCYRLGTALRFDPQEIRAWVGKFHHSPGGT